jgi:beta-N-acetylhexosaminidase
VYSKKDVRLLAGQVFCLRLPPDAEHLDLKRFPVANYIVFADALAKSFDGSKERLLEARVTMGEYGIEPIFMTDEEGGRVSQISGFFPQAPSPAAVSRSLKPDEARELYARLSEGLAVLGIDVNLAPCVDVNTETLNPIIGTRAFGTVPDVVATYAGAFVEGARAYTGCVAKHFPGHGMTAVDSHLDMPAVDSPRSNLESLHIAPFRETIRAGTDGIMVSHCYYDALQADNLPASLSRSVVYDLVRRELAFDGLVITDSLDMDAVTKNFKPAEAAIKAFNAGVDILLYTEESRRFEEAFEAMAAGLISGSIDRGRLTESIVRRHALLDRLSSRRYPEGVTALEHYLELRGRAMAGSLRKDDPRGLLPLEVGEIALVTTDPGMLEKARLYAGGAMELGTAPEARDKVLLLWLMEPLRLKHSVESMRRMIKASRHAVLVTSYPSMADALRPCEATIITADTSLETQETIVREVFGPSC